MNLNAPSERSSLHSGTLRSPTRAVSNLPKKKEKTSNGSEISVHTWISYSNVIYPMTRSQPKERNLRVRPSSLRKKRDPDQVKSLNLGMRPKSETETFPNTVTIHLAKLIGHGNARAARHREMPPELKQDQKQHPLDASTALTIQGCRRIHSTTVQLTADKIQLTGSNRKDPTLIKHHSKLPSATCSTSNRTSTDLATTRRKMESANREDPSEAIEMTSKWTAKTPRKRQEERDEEERND